MNFTASFISFIFKVAFENWRVLTLRLMLKGLSI